MRSKSAGDAASVTSSRSSLLTRLSGALAPLSFLIILSIALTFLSPNFATRGNLKQIAVQAAVVAILACGQTAVIISGNIDLSVGAVMALCGVVAAQTMSVAHVGMWPAVLIACACGVIVGMLNGVITAYGRIPAFIVTLGMMGIARGAAGIVSNSQSIGNLAPGFDMFGFRELFGSESSDGIPYAVLIMLAVAVAMYLVLARTRLGRSIYAMGGNQEAARLSGVHIPKLTTTVFAISGLLAGVAAVVNISRASIASMSAGDGYELDAVAATVVGGTSLFGGQGGIFGTIIGAVLIFTIRNGCALRGIGPDYQKAIIGFVVILAVLYDRYGPGKKR